jgi:hypothetical protein
VFSLLEFLRTTLHTTNQSPISSETINAMEATIEFSPAMPWPQPPDIQKRIQELRGYLDPNNPNYQPEQQHTNIKAAIKLYEDRKVVPRKEIFRGNPWSRCEGRFYQLAQKHTLLRQREE